MSRTIFMIHGMFGGPWSWDTFRVFFENRGYRCVATTLRYHDMSPDDEPDARLGSTSLLDYVTDLEAEIDRLDELPIIMGHSMGGLLAQMLGARKKAAALILVAPASPAGILAITPSILKTFFKVQSKWGFWKKPFRLSYKASANSILNLLPHMEQRTIYNSFVYESGRAAAEIGWWFFDPKRATAVDDSNVSCPILVIGGTKDNVTPVSVVRKIALKYGKNTTFKVFENHAHWPMKEPGWEEAAHCIASWIKQKYPHQNF